MLKKYGLKIKGQPRKKIFLRFIFLSWSITVFTVIIFSMWTIPDQRMKIISMMKVNSKMVHSAVLPVVKSSVLLEDFASVIEHCLWVVKENPSVLYIVFSRNDGFSLVHLRDEWYQRVFDPETEIIAQLTGEAPRILYSQFAKKEVFNTNYPVTYMGIDWGHLFIGLSTEKYHQELTTLYVRSFWIAAISVIMGFFLSYILAKRLTTPIRTLAETTRQIGEGNLDARADIKTGDEIESLADSVNQMALALSLSRDEIKKKHDELLDAAHRAGMAEVAIDVLHNVGNVLNSINVISASVKKRVKNSRLNHLSLLSQEINDNENRLPDYFSEPGRAGKFVHFLSQLDSHFDNENRTILNDMESLSRHTNHIIEIISFQQLYSKTTGVMELADINDLIDMAVKINDSSIKKNQVSVIFDHIPVPQMFLDRHKVIQILSNLIGNAIDAVVERNFTEKKINIETAIEDDMVMVTTVRDNGIGIPENHLTKIFTHGFTTKKNGHGFGLHSCALFAQEMKGSINVSSNGTDQGACFRLRLPVIYRMDRE